LWLALANLWYRDVKYLFTVGIQMWMFLTNVLYPLPESGSTTMRLLMAANPMVPIISAYRAIVIEGRMPEPAGLVGLAVVAVLLAWSGWVMYRVLEGRFAERV
jgi:ABC-type polysaccharide/polyol phosphate export permease